MLTGTALGLAVLLSRTQDTIPADTLRRARLPDLEVTVTRRRDSLSRIPLAIGVVTGPDLRRGQPTLGLDEALTAVPGVYVANRWNYSVDQRLSIRGFGSRANFGVRGVKVFLDGVPQTLPDGQSQLSNVELATLDRIEVLRGTSSALYGNASGGALLLETEPPGPAPLGLAARLEAGSFGTAKWLVRGSGRAGQAAGSLMVSRLTTDGFRQHSAADIRQLNGALSWAFSGSTRATVRLLLNDTPRAENPGALTAAEYAARRDSAAAGNILRGADKRVSQQQLSLRLEHGGRNGGAAAVTLYGLLRDLENPLAAPPPGPFSPTAGTWNTIDRVAGGARLEATVGPGPTLGLTLGLDVQRMRDHRVNLRSEGGAPTDSTLADQLETVTEAAPFAQARWQALPDLRVDAGIRYDRIRFAVSDRHLTDGVDHSGSSDLGAVSGNLGAAWQATSWLSPYGQLSTAFETPTTTELVSTASGGVGFNTDLGPQRAATIEVGARARTGEAVVTLALFQSSVRDAITQQREVSGRAFFANAGRTRNRGLEAGITAPIRSRVTFSGAWTLADYRFTDYRIRNGARVDTLTGNRLAGVPRHFARLAVRLRPAGGLTVDLDQLLSSALYADDANDQRVDDWGDGVTHLRLGWSGSVGSVGLTPFLSVFNLFDRRYVGSVTINAVGGRVLEPSAGRYLFVGTGLSWARRAGEPL